LAFELKSISLKNFPEVELMVSSNIFSPTRLNTSTDAFRFSDDAKLNLNFPSDGLGAIEKEVTSSSLTPVKQEEGEKITYLSSEKTVGHPWKFIAQVWYPVLITE
jgi:hypothetical protein